MALSRNSASPRSRSRTPNDIINKTEINQSNNEYKENETDSNKTQKMSKSSSRSGSRSASSSRSRSRSRSRSKKRRSDRRDDKSRRHRRRSKSRSSRSRSRGRYSDNKERKRRRHSRSVSRRSYSSRSPSPYHRRMNPSPCRVLGVFGLNFQTGERELKRTFEKYGRLDKVKLVTDPRTGRSRGFAFIYYQNVEDAEEAKEKIHGQELDGNHVRVEYSISNREHNPTPGVYMGRRTATSRYNDSRDDDYYSNSKRHGISRSRSKSYEKRRRSYSKDY